MERCVMSESKDLARRVEKIEAESLALKDILFRALLNITGDDWREAASEATKGYSPYQPGKDLSGSCK